MNFYENEKYLKNLLLEPLEFKKQCILSHGEVIYEMFDKNIIPPLDLISSLEARSSIAIVMAKLYSNYYSENEFNLFLSKVKEDNFKINKEEKTGSDFLKDKRISMKKHMFVAPKIKIKISNLQDIFIYINEFVDLLSKDGNGENFSVERKKEISKALLNISEKEINLLKGINEPSAIKLLEKNSENIYKFQIEYPENFEQTKINDVIYKIIENVNFKQVSDKVKVLAPINLMLTHATKSDDNIAFLKESILLKMKLDNNVIELSLDYREIDKLKILKLDKDNIVDKSIALELVRLASKKIYSHVDFRMFVLKSPIAKIIPVSELKDKFHNANKLGSEFKDEDIWGEESINNIVKRASFNINKSFDIDDLYKYLENGRAYQDKFLSNIKIPLEFLQKVDEKIQANGGVFLYENSYYIDSSISGKREGFQLQILHYLIDKNLKYIRENNNINPEDIEYYKDFLEFINKNFKSLTTRDTQLHKNKHDEPGRTEVLLDAIRLENKIYDFAKEYFKISQDNFKYSDIEYFKNIYRHGSSELSFGFLSALAQKIKNPNMLWVLPSLEKNTNLYSYSGKNVNSLIEEGMPLEESLKSILELPLINNNIVKKNVSEIEDYQGSRSNLIKNNNNNRLVYIAMISQLRDREGFPELSDSDFNLQLNGIKDFIHKNKNFYQNEKEIKSIEKEIKNQQKKLGFDFKENTKLSDNYILSLEYLHNNFSLELLYNHLESDIDVLSKWYDLKKESIDNKFVKIIIKEVFNIFYKENNYFSNNSQEDLLKGSEDFIFKLVLNCPEDFKDIKNQLLRGPHGKIYEKIFVSSDREIVKELIENKNHQKLKELYNLSTYTDIKNNFGKFLSSNNIQLIDVLFQELPSNKFAEFFNTCTYQEQRYLLNQESFLSKAMEPINNGEKIKFNCESFENFKEVFEKLRLKNHLYFLTSESNNDLDFINYKIKWECCSLLKFISVPKIDSVIEYLIDEMPLSFSTSYELSLRDNYSGFLPRNLNSQEFIKLVKKVNEECKGIMYIPQSQNSSGSIHNCLVNENIVGKSKSLKMQNINASLDLYLTILEDLQFSPKDYALIFVSLQKLIANNLTSLIVSEPLVKNDYLSKRVYSWAEIPKDCLVLNEIKLIFDSKYHMLDNLNTFNSNINSSEEYIHNFFNVFIDKKIYLEGLRLIREDNLLNDGVCNNRFRSFNINCISPYKYNAKDSDYESLYITNYSVEELEKFTDDIAKVNPSLWFDSNLPKLAILKTQELRKLVAENKDKFFGSLNDNDYKTAKDNSLLTFIDENINSKNIWSALLACSETYEDSIKNAEREFIFNEILSKPNLDVKTLKKISFLIDLQTELSSDNDLMYQNKSLLYKLEKGILYCFTSPELKIKKIVVENLIMDLQIKIPDSKGKVMKL